LHAGLGLVQALASRNDTVVFAGARDPSAAKDLQELEAQYPGKVHTVKLIANDEQGNRDAVEYVRTKTGRLDVVVANAGKYFRPPNGANSVDSSP
jgi:NAD(P)-dependent dehydrogenase (short-subunit alcohol dehydrogenase family)